MNRLITIPFSHFCEKARWGLDLLVREGRLTYVEEGHLPFFSRRATRPHGSRQVPLWVTPDGVVTDSTDILKWVDVRLPSEQTLYPHADVLSVEEELDARFGPDVRRVAYFHLMADPKVIERFMSEAKVPTLERRVLKLRPLRMAALALMRKGLGLTADRTQRSTDRIFATMSAMEERLKHQRYLAGDTFSAADLTFAALAGPLLLPPQYPLGWPDLHTMPGALRDLVQRAQESRAGQHVLAVYRDHR